MAISLVFQGDTLEEVEDEAIRYVASLPGTGIEAKDEVTPEPKPKKASAKKKASKKKASKKKAAVAPDDPNDLFGDDDDDDAFGGDDDNGSSEDEDNFEDDSPPTIEDVRDALGALVDVRSGKVAKKLLTTYGDVEELAELDEALYAKIIANCNLVIEKAKAKSA